MIATAIVISGSDRNRGVASDSDIASTSHSHIDSDGNSDCDNAIVMSDGESDNNSYRHSYCYSDSEWQWRSQLQSDSAVRFMRKPHTTQRRGHLRVAISTVSDASGSGRVDMLTGPVAAARADVATRAWV